MDGIMNIVYAILVLGIMGAVFGGLLAFAAKIFHVEQDPRIEEVRAAVMPTLSSAPVYLLVSFSMFFPPVIYLSLIHI